VHVAQRRRNGRGAADTLTPIEGYPPGLCGFLACLWQESTCSNHALLHQLTPPAMQYAYGTEWIRLRTHGRKGRLVGAEPPEEKREPSHEEVEQK
jgi:hypothetical protein